MANRKKYKFPEQMYALFDDPGTDSLIYASNQEELYYHVGDGEVVATYKLVSIGRAKRTLTIEKEAA